MTIRLRLALLITAVAALLVAGGGVLFVHELNVQLEHQLNVTLDARADVISSELTGSGSNLDVPARLDSDGGIYAQLLSAKGVVLNSSRAVAGSPLITPGQAAESIHSSLTLDRNVLLHTRGDVGLEAMHILAAPSGHPDVVVAVAISRDLVDKVGVGVTYQLLVAGGIVLLLVGPGAWWVAGAALRPVERMRARVARLDADEIKDGVPVPDTKDEIARLGRTFNGLLGRVHTALEHERSFVADAGHELRTPLSVLKGEFELAQRPGRTREQLLDTVDIAAEETDRLIQLSDNLLGLARGGPVIQQLVDVADVARRSVAAIDPSAATRNVSLTMHDDAVGLVYGDEQRLRQAIDNLLTNAVRYSPAGTTITIRLARQGADAVVEVADQGPGFPVEFLPIAFDRFTRADDARSRSQGGNGLGLAVVMAIMTAHAGTVTAANRAEGGAVLTLRWAQPAS